ncbi:MAG: hypothetical protein KIT27_07540 [Legionellales bacterium]|nr:hypothetical protein [Legionellales bacterium]
MFSKSANYIMEKPERAIVAALVLSMLGPLAWLSQVIVALVTLRRGAKAGAVIALSAMAGCLALAWFVSPVALLRFIPDVIIVWSMALVLRKTESWALMLQILAAIGMLTVIIVHAVVPEVIQFWTQQLSLYFAEMSQHFADIRTAFDANFIESIASVYTGLLASSMMINVFLQLLLARFLQAKLYHPGGLSAELNRLRLHWLAMAVLAIVALGVLLNNALATDVIPTVLTLFFIVGMCLIHQLAYRKQRGFWLIAVYVMLIVFFPYAEGVLVIFAMIDTCFSRSRMYFFSKLK